MTKLATGILAGGSSVRMGRDKAFLKLNQETFIERLSCELSKIARPVVSFASPGGTEHKDFFDYTVVYDQNQHIGPIEGIRQILKAADADYVFICAVDMPYISSFLVKYMEQFISSDYDCYVMQSAEKIQPLCAIYSKAVLPFIDELIEKKTYRLQEILNRARTKYISLELSPFNKNVVKNINFPEEYKEIVEKPVVFSVCGYKNSGKTTLIEKLILEFKARNRGVCVIKHDAHDFSLDQEGTDTKRFTDAGADISSIFSERKFFFSAEGKTDVFRMMEIMKSIKKDEKNFVLIVEGCKNSELPKIVIDTKDKIPELSNVICKVDENGRNDIPFIFSKLKEYFNVQDF